MENTENRNSQVSPEGLYPEREIRLSPVNTGADYILPDYMGDIRKVLNYSAKIIPSGRFLGEGEVSFVGIVCYSVIYLDSENKLTEASFNSDYEYEVKCDEGFVDAESRAEMGSLFVRPSAPRKLSAKAVLNPTVFMTEDRTPPMPTASESTEMLPAVVKESSMSLFRLGEREYAEEGARLSGVLADEVEILLYGGDAVITNTVCRGGELRIEGNLKLYALLMLDGETPLRVEKSIPISEVIAAECDDGAVIVAEAFITSQRVTVNNVPDSENGEGSSEAQSSVTFDVTAELFARAYGNRETSVALDAFSTNGSSECRFCDYSYTGFAGTVKEEIPLSFELERGAFDAEDITDILLTGAKFTQNVCEVRDGAIYLDGDVSFFILAQTPGECGYASHKYTQSLNQTIKLPFAAKENSVTDAMITLHSAETTLDNTRLYIKCKMLCEIIVKESCKMRIVEDMTTKVSENEEYSGGTITVYYPGKDDTLWSVAKKYRKPVASLAEENMLSSECISSGGRVSLADVERIFITKNI